MTRTPLLSLLALLLATLLHTPVGLAAPHHELYITDGEQIALVRDRVRAGDPTLKPAVDALVQLAEESMDAPMRSVVEKPTIPPSGDKNDYVSLSPYWWPNPDTPDGLPYIRRDGEINPERFEYDVDKLSTFGNCVRWLGFAYYYTGDERYAQEAVKRIRHFLIDPETRMNPRMRYGQFIPGRNDGRKFGIIETLRLRWVPEAITLLSESEAMTDEDYAAAKQWFGDYARWLNTSEFGVAERDGANNHGTWGEAQIAYFSLFAGDTETVREMAARVPHRISHQIEPDGRQPHELARTRALDYSEFNLRGHSELAILADKVGVDLWNYETEDGRSIRAAIDYILPYLTEEKPWPYQQISPPRHDFYAQTLRRMAIGLNDPRYEAALAKLDRITGEGLIYRDLIIPLPADFPSE
ncbi:alginate lyase family protein [Mucisphaera sp.]|uniref:alginate lyase family protein n=1 Tax=Mucisphaera sp. TaxID=2913024 RepID=UPI003D125DD5